MLETGITIACRDGADEGGWRQLTRAGLAATAFGVAIDGIVSSTVGGGASAATSAILGFPLILAAGMQIAARGRIRIPSAPLLFLSAFVAWAAASGLWATDQEAFLKRPTTYLQLLAMVWLGWQILRSERDLRAALAGFLAGCVVVVALAWRAFYTGAASYEGGTRYAATGFDANDMSVTLAVGIPMAAYFALQRRRWGPLALLYAPLAGSAIALSGSRGGALTASLATVLVLGWLARRPRAAVSLLLALVVLGAVLSAPIVRPESLARIFTLREEVTSGTLGERTQIWRAGLDLLLRHPIAGVGAGGFAQAVLPVLHGRIVAHSTLLSVAVELGAIGLGLFLGAVVAVLRGAMQSTGNHRNLALILTATWLLGSASLTWEHRKTTWLVFLLCAAVGALRAPSTGDQAQ